jgi:hypothetical protein
LHKITRSILVQTRLEVAAFGNFCIWHFRSWRA